MYAPWAVSFAARIASWAMATPSACAFAPDPAWRIHTSRLGWLIAVALLLAAVIYGLKIFHVIVPEPPFDPNLTGVDVILAGFDHAQEHWLEDLTSSLLFAIGFAGIAVLGLVLRHATNRDDARSGMMTVAFVVAGTLGIAAQLIYLGAIEAATSPEYCDACVHAKYCISSHGEQQGTAARPPGS